MTISQLRQNVADHIARSVPKGAIAVGMTDDGERVYRFPMKVGAAKESLHVLLPLRLFNAEVRKLARSHPRSQIRIQPTSTWHPTWTLRPFPTCEKP